MQKEGLEPLGGLPHPREQGSKFGTWRKEGAPGSGRPEHSPSSEEKEAGVSIPLWKFSSIFRPSSMFGPVQENL